MTTELFEARHEVGVPMIECQIREEPFGLTLQRGFDPEDCLRRYVSSRRAEDIEIIVDDDGVAMCEFEGHVLLAVPRAA